VQLSGNRAALSILCGWTNGWCLSADAIKTSIALGPLPCSFQTSFANVRFIAEGLPRVAMTTQTITIPFRKTAACPSSAQLLLLRGGKLSMKRSSLVGQHLETCDFCNAELRLLAHHRGSRQKTRVPQIPKNLRILAESILRKAWLLGWALVDKPSNEKRGRHFQSGASLLLQSSNSPQIRSAKKSETSVLGAQASPPARVERCPDRCATVR